MSAFRALAPSALQDESSASSPAKLTPTDSVSGGNSGGGATHGGVGEDGGGNAGSGGDGGQRKRRAAGSVSQMACTLCRAARQRVSSLT